MSDLNVRTFSGEAIGPYLGDLARLRITVFRDWPYLYDGDEASEAMYLRAYLRTPHSVVVLVFDGDHAVGASTGLPLASEPEAFLAPLADSAIDPDEVFYCGESVLLPAYRGRGLGHLFFDERESHARALGGFAWSAFCAVDRTVGDPRQPAFHRGNEVFWHKRGYAPRPGLQVTLPWREVGLGEVAHTLTYWMRPLESSP